MRDSFEFPTIQFRASKGIALKAVLFAAVLWILYTIVSGMFAWHETLVSLSAMSAVAIRYTLKGTLSRDNMGSWIFTPTSPFTRRIIRRYLRDFGLASDGIVYIQSEDEKIDLCGMILRAEYCEDQISVNHDTIDDHLSLGEVDVYFDVWEGLHLYGWDTHTLNESGKIKGRVIYLSLIVFAVSALFGFFESATDLTSLSAVSLIPIARAHIAECARAIADSMTALKRAYMLAIWSQGMYSSRFWANGCEIISDVSTAIDLRNDRNARARVSPWIGRNGYRNLTNTRNAMPILPEIAERAARMVCEIDALEVLRELPGLGLSKAGFLLQLMGRAERLGCLDAVSIASYGLDPAELDRMNKRKNGATEYAALCADLGGSVRLWADWCESVGRRDNFDPALLSAAHARLVIGGSRYPLTIPGETILRKGETGFTVDLLLPGARFIVGRESALSYDEAKAKALLTCAPCFGGWIDEKTGRYHWDVNDRFDSLSEALEIARMREEVAIWDSVEGKEIRVSEAAYTHTNGKPVQPAGSYV